MVVSTTHYRLSLLERKGLREFTIRYNWKGGNFITYQKVEADITLYSFREEAEAMLIKLIREGKWNRINHV